MDNNQATTSNEHTCHGAIFCGAPVAVARTECPGYTCRGYNEFTTYASCDGHDYPDEFGVVRTERNPNNRSGWTYYCDGACKS